MFLRFGIQGYLSVTAKYCQDLLFDIVRDFNQKRLKKRLNTQFSFEHTSAI